MTISYTLTPSDHWGLNRYVMTHDLKQGGLLAVAALLIPVMLLQSQIAAGKPWQDAAGSALTVVILSMLAGYPVLRFIAWSKFRKLPPHTHTIQMTLTDKGIDLATPKASQTLKWGAIRKVRRDGRSIYLFIAPRIALVAPLRAFSSKAEAKAFEEFASAHAAQA